jgi:hypothetical protein
MKVIRVSLTLDPMLEQEARSNALEQRPGFFQGSRAEPVVKGLQVKRLIESE